VGFGLPAGALALLLVGGLAVTPVIAGLWWAFPRAPWLPVVSEPITGWGTALSLGAVNLFVLGGLAAIVLPLVARAHARCCLAILAPSPAERLVERVTELTRTRVDVLQAHSAELRRIERDLHDGTQARLVAIAMRLAVAGETYADDPEAAAALVRQAQAETEDAMTELRSVIHTIYPPVLADQGLAGALATLTARAGVPTRLDIGPLGEIPAAVEAVAYFAVTEALANIARHSGATDASIRVTRDGALLRTQVVDNGIGGADAARGSGLDGMRRRAAALDGAVDISSPPGGPTVITLELPCA
jgi:signal transduction histidine kinase